MGHKVSRGATPRARPLLTALVAASAIAGLFAPAPAEAQRGGDFAVQEPAVDTPRSGFPGAFNTHTVERDGVVASLPLLQVDYGATENLSLGVNLLPTAAALGGALPGAMGRVRYRIYDDGTFSSVAELQAGYLPIALDSDESLDRVWGVYGSATVGYQLSPRQRLSATALAATLRMANDDYLERYRFDAVGLAVDYEAFTTERIGLSVTALGAPLLATAFDAPGGASSFTFNLDVPDRVVVRTLLLIRGGRTWLFDVGAITPLSLVATMPWFGVTKRW
jgi:hypothetical protein